MFGEQTFRLSSIKKRIIVRRSVGEVTDRPIKNGFKSKQKPKAVSVVVAGSCMHVEGEPVLWTL